MSARSAMLTIILGTTSAVAEAQLVAHAHGDGAVHVSARRTIHAAVAGPIVLDGQLIEPGWQGARHAPTTNVLIAKATYRLAF